MKLEVLTDKQVQRIHEASISVLEDTGVHLPHAEALQLFEKAGADVDYEHQRVRIPEMIVMEACTAAGKHFAIYGRDRSKQAVFGGGKRNYNSTYGEAFWVDDAFSARRYASLADVAYAARLGDVLPEITICGAMSDPIEIAPEYRCVFVAAEMLKHTTKPIGFWFHDRTSAKFLLELFALVADSESEAAQHPFAYAFLEAISPLRFPFHGVDLLFETARFPLPVHLGPMAQTGATAPGTLAGTLVQENAELLASICLVQLIRPGTPVCYGGIPHIFDMNTSQMVFAGPEQALMAVAMTQMGKSYNLPVYINVGLTDSKTADAQAGFEIGVTLACGALAGADIFGHLGIVGVDQASSAITLVLQNEIIGYLERMLRGIEIDDDTLGLGVISQVGPGGNYLAEEHTALHFRNEFWFPKVFDRDFWEPWAGKGRKDTLARCREQRDAYLAQYVPHPLADDTLKAMDKFLADAKRHLAKS